MVFQPDILKDRVAIVTGGGTGIGRAIALSFARHGAHVVVASRRMEHLAGVVGEIRGLSRKALAVPTDVRVQEQVQQMVRRTLEEFGRIDILVHNAGGRFDAPAEELSLNGFNAVVAIGAQGTFLCCQEVGKVMIRQRGGCIINITSSLPLTGSAGALHVGVQKAAQDNITKSLAIEWARYNIRVNAIAPGSILVEWVQERLEQMPEEERARAEEQVRLGVPLGRRGTGEEIANGALYLASDAAAYITGHTLVIDGGVLYSRWEGGERQRR